jgi:hypothetical protein
MSTKEEEGVIMESTSRVQPPIWYWIITSLIVIFTVLGIVGLILFLAGVLESTLPPEPTFWLITITALAMLGDLGGSIGLVARRHWAIPAFAFALVLALVYCGYQYVAVPDSSLFSLMLALPRAAGFWLAIVSRARGWSSGAAALRTSAASTAPAP